MDYEYSEQDKKEIQEERHVRRRQAADDFSDAARLANEHGLVLTQCTEAHYQIRAFEDGHVCWLYNVYPGKRRIWPDRKYRGPFIHLPMNWGLVDVVEAVAKRHEERETNE